MQQNTQYSGNYHPTGTGTTTFTTTTSTTSFTGTTSTATAPQGYQPEYYYNTEPAPPNYSQSPQLYPAVPVNYTAPSINMPVQQAVPAAQQKQTTTTQSISVPIFGTLTTKTKVVKDTSLPQGWEMRTDPQGRTYYVDHVRQATTYNDPRQMTPLSPQMAPQPTYVVQQPGVAPVQKVTTVERSFNVLDPTYWLHGPTVKKTTTTVIPTTTVVPVAVQPVMIGSGPLPPNWDVAYDAQGQPYFVDHVHKTTTYNDPRLRK